MANDLPDSLSRNTVSVDVTIRIFNPCNNPLVVDFYVCGSLVFRIVVELDYTHADVYTSNIVKGVGLSH
jgi:hypothetical protein